MHRRLKGELRMPFKYVELCTDDTVPIRAGQRAVEIANAVLTWDEEEGRAIRIGNSAESS